MRHVALTETQWQEQVTGLAEHLGWSWVHFRPARTATGWATPVSGPLGKGWPDLVLVRERVIFVELKADQGRTSPAQWSVLEALKDAAAEFFVWRPIDFEQVHETLARRAA